MLLTLPQFTIKLLISFLNISLYIKQSFDIVSEELIFQISAFTKKSFVVFYEQLRIPDSTSKELKIYENF